MDFCKNFLICFCFLTAFLAFSQQTFASDISGYDLEVILDVSGSMGAELGGERKIDIAKKAVRKIVREIPRDTLMGFRAYGHQSPRNEKNCSDTQLIYPVGKLNQDQLIEKLSLLEPRGYTPIDYSLRQAVNDFPAASEVGKMIILVSDGEETCGGDPCAAVRELRQSGFKVVINSIGFDVNAKAEQQLKCVADASGGEYRRARDAGELTKTLSDFAQRAARKYTATGGKIEPGTGFGNAVLVAPGDYKTDIMNDEVHFYKLEVKKGQTLTAVANVKSKNTDSGSCSSFFKIRILDKFKRQRSDFSAPAFADASDPKSYSASSKFDQDQLVYFTISRSNSCPEHTFLYELGLYLEE